MRRSLKGRILFAAFCLLVLISVAVLSGVREDVHKFEGRCENCHLNLPRGVRGERLLFVKGISELCLDCHDSSAARSHPVDVVPSMRVPEDLHLDWEGRITCATCHDVHQKRRTFFGKQRFFLRRLETGKLLCHGCHDALLEEGHRAVLGVAHMSSSYRVTDAERAIDDASFSCLGCHGSGLAGSAPAEIGAGIWDHGQGVTSHPIGVEYPTGPESRRDYVDIGRLPPQIHLIDRKVGCTTCHNPYSREKNQLVMSNRGSAMCVSCHKR